jgi:chorismate mutase/prephenate dehydratase
LVCDEINLQAIKIERESRELAKFTAFLFLEEKMNLKDWRKEIDELDERIVGLLNERAAVASKIGALKAAAGLPVTDAAREEQILRNAARLGKGALKREAVVRIFRAVIRESRNVQNDVQSNAAAKRSL